MTKQLYPIIFDQIVIEEVKPLSLQIQNSINRSPTDSEYCVPQIMTISLFFFKKCPVEPRNSLSHLISDVHT